MQYSMPRDGRSGEPPRVLQDWICPKVRKNRETYFIEDANLLFFSAEFKIFEDAISVSSVRNSDQMLTALAREQTKSVHIRLTVNSFEFFEKTHKLRLIEFAAVLLRGLDALSTEDSVLSCLTKVTQMPIKSIRIGKDSLTGTSRGVCYVEMNTVMDAMFLHNQLLGEPPTIDDRLISVSYFRSPTTPSLSTSGGGQNSSGAPTTGKANAALAAAQWSHQGKSKYSEEEIERMAEYSASMYAKNPGEKAHYLEYYRNYYRNGGDSSSSAPGGKQSSSSSSKNGQDLGRVTVNGVEYSRYRKSKVNQEKMELVILRVIFHFQQHLMSAPTLMRKRRAITTIARHSCITTPTRNTTTIQKPTSTCIGMGTIILTSPLRMAPRAKTRMTAVAGAKRTRSSPPRRSPKIWKSGQKR